MIGRLILICGVVTLLSGCKCNSDSKHDQPAKTPVTKKSAPLFPPPILEMKQLADEMCACKTKPCAQDVSRRYMKVVRAHGRLKLPRRQHGIMVDHQRRLSECLKRILR